MPDQTSTDKEMKAAARRRTLAWAIIGLIALILFLLFSPLWPVPFLDKVDCVGNAVCGRIPDHSLHLADRQLPLCARCTGTFTGALLGFTGLLLLGKGKAAQMPPARVLGLLIGFIILMAIDGLNSYLSLLTNTLQLYQPHNFLRLLTGTLHGVALSIIVFPIFNFTLWKEPDKRPALAGFRDLGLVLLLLALPVVLIVQAEIDLLLYPVAIISALGVLTMLTVVNSLMIIIAIRREAQAVAWWDAALPIALGFAATLIEIAVIVLLRWQFSLTFGIPF
ncbi:MAG: hypothetical protein CEE40_10350 [Chloroflexi bacterium B3_Chlor]|nr:MAG: hypothetical protein CEE40_10350 [Chloroflexi bacterium B3_Chlor]